MSFANDNNEGAESPEHVRSLSVSLGVITDSPDQQENLAHFSVTTALTYCKTKILKPYLRFLCLVGLRSFFGDGFSAKKLFGTIYIFLLITVMISGYLLQYMACFRRDRGFSYILYHRKDDLNAEYHIHESVCNGSVTFSYVVPHLLHFIGYMSALRTFRSSDDDQLPSLMESVFLTLTNLNDGFQSQKRLVRTLWICLGATFLWMIVSLTVVTIMLGLGKIEFKWMRDGDQSTMLTLKILLVVSTLTHDVIQATVISNYCLQTQLLFSYVQFLKAKLLQHSMLAMEWMRDMEGFRKLLHFLNSCLAPSVSVFTLLNVTRAITGVLWIFNLDNIDRNYWSNYGSCVINIFLWFVLALAPFIQAARLCNSFEDIRGVGQELRVQPFPSHISYDNVERLDSLMLYASSLKLKATLFGLKIKPSHIYFLFTLSSLIVIILGQLHYFGFK